MKYFKMLNSETGKTVIATEAAKKGYEGNKLLKKKMVLMYECTEDGVRTDGKLDLPKNEQSMNEIFDLKNENNGQKNEATKADGDDVRKEDVKGRFAEVGEEEFVYETFTSGGGPEGPLDEEFKYE